MRLVQVSIPTGKRETVLSTLDEAGIDYVLSEEASSRSYDAVVSFPLPTTAVEPVLEELRAVGVERDAYIVVIATETVVSNQFEALEERFADENGDGGRIAREELRSTVESLAPSSRSYALMTVVSAIIATAGLLLDSPAVVVGSMVIAPLVGPAMAASVGTVLDENNLFRRGVVLQVGGLVLAIVAAAAFAAVVRSVGLVPPMLDITAVSQIQERLTPDFLSLAVALGAGVAGVVSLSTGVSTALVGVMIAVALMPPAATVGIGIAWGQPGVALGAGVLALVNGLSINLAAIAVLWYAGYRPGQLFQRDEARSATVRRGAALVVALLVLSAFIGGVTLSTIGNSGFERQANEEVRAELAAHDARLLSVSVTSVGGPLFDRPEAVTVVVGEPAGVDTDGLAPRIRNAIIAETDRSVSVTVRTVRIETAESTE
ncbi:TIGR00341 family protein [Halobacteriales archaeon SW_7_68_16]|nr:MAG: TIGR00341 family protein [Halobacteriales archaeon SW_7_68_16]